MPYLLLGLVLAIITASVAAWMKLAGGDDCWATVARRGNSLRVLDAHPRAFVRA